MEDECQNCEDLFETSAPDEMPAARWGTSDFCVPCVRKCAGAVTLDHACMVCMDVVHDGTW